MDRFITIEFGKGNIGVAQAKFRDGVAITLRSLNKEYEPGQSLELEPVGEPILALSFTNRDSVDVVIEALRGIRDKIITFTTA